MRSPSCVPIIPAGSCKIARERAAHPPRLSASYVGGFAAAAHLNLQVTRRCLLWFEVRCCYSASGPYADLRAKSLMRLVQAGSKKDTVSHAGTLTMFWACRSGAISADQSRSRATFRNADKACE